MNQPIFLPEGTRLIVRKDRQLYGAAFALVTTQSETSVVEIANTVLLQVALGQCLVEDLGENPQCVWETLKHYGPTRKALYNEMHFPHVYRYTLRDGTRFFFIVCAQGTDFSLFLADKPAELDNPNWEQLFLANE